MHIHFLFLSINLSLPHPSIHIHFLFLSINLTLPHPSIHLPFLFLSINLSLPHPSIHLSFLFLSINLTLPSPIRHLPFLILSCVHQSHFTPHFYLPYLSIPFPPFYQSSLLSTNQPTLPYAFLSYSLHCLNPFSGLFFTPSLLHTLDIFLSYPIPFLSLLSTNLSQPFHLTFLTTHFPDKLYCLPVSPFRFLFSKYPDKSFFCFTFFPHLIET